MSVSFDMLRDFLWQFTLLASPIFIAIWLIGIIFAILQAITQIQDNAIATIPKFVAVFMLLAIIGPWMLAHLQQFMTHWIYKIPEVVR